MENYLPVVLGELDRATQLHGEFVSHHEGYAVILEELDELWQEIKTNPRNSDKVRKEAVQLAAMTLKFLEFVD
jgi:hypothetical protein